MQLRPDALQWNNLILVSTPLQAMGQLLQEQPSLSSWALVCSLDRGCPALPSKICAVKVTSVRLSSGSALVTESLIELW